MHLQRLARNSWREPLATISTKRCIDTARVYQPGFAGYITLKVTCKMLSRVKEKLQAHASEVLLAALGTALPAWLLLAESRLVPHVSQLDPTTVIRAAALSLVVTLWAFALFLFFRPRLKFDSRLGIYRDRKSELHFCPSCHTKKIRSPLKEQVNGWRCSVKECMLFFPNPDHKSPPPAPPIRAVRQSAWAVRDW
jgi:hypothetical protein